MMYRHVKYDIVWLMLNEQRTKAKLIHKGTKFSDSEVGKIIKISLSEVDEWDERSEWELYGFGEYLKKLL